MATHLNPLSSFDYRMASLRRADLRLRYIVTGRGIQPPAIPLPPQAVAPSRSAMSAAVRKRFLTMMARMRRWWSAPPEERGTCPLGNRIAILSVSLGNARFSRTALVAALELD